MRTEILRWDQIVDVAVRQALLDDARTGERKLPSSPLDTVDAKTLPGNRPLQGLTSAEVGKRFERALAKADGFSGAHCVHEMWMRGEMSINIERALERLWVCAADSIPEWLPTQYIEWLPRAYEIASRFRAAGKGRSNIYLVLLDYGDSPAGPHGLYVGMSKYSPAQRFDQHKAGIRAAGSVLKRGLEVLTGPTLHLQYIKRAEAERIEIELAEALAAAGLLVKGGH
jgi:hypothetical protein